MIISQPIIVLSLLVALAGPVNAQKQLIWHKGEAVLITGITLRGELSYQPQLDALLFRQAGKTHTYTTDELRRFRYMDVATNKPCVVATYDVPQSMGDPRALLFDELVSGVAVRLLQLPAPHTAQWAKKNGLPRTLNHNWQTPQPWYVWIDGRFVALDDFVKTDLDELIAAAPEAVQQWANRIARPSSPMALARWLTYFNGRVTKAQLPSQPNLKPPISAWYPVH